MKNISVARDSGNDFAHFSFRFLKVGSRLSKISVIILPGMQILQVFSPISDWSQFCFSFLIFYVTPSRIKLFRVPSHSNLDPEDH